MHLHAIAFLFVTTISSVSGQTPELKKQQVGIVTSWNELAVSIEKENLLLTDLTVSLRLSPPWRVVDAREPEKRAKLIDTIIAEHKRRIALLEKIKAADQ